MSKTICVLPWNHLATHPDGSVTLCCRVNFAEEQGFSEESEGQRLNLNASSLEKISNSQSFQNTRLQMLAGKEPAACKGCYQEEKAGLHSKRLLENANFPQTLDKIINENESKIQNPQYEFIELRLGNLCNLRCRTCNPNSSISWVKEYAELEKQLDFVTHYETPSTHWTESEQFWTELSERSKKAKLIYINGGEPMLIKMHWEYLKSLARSGDAARIHIWYNTNMTKLPEEAFEIWKNFGKVTISASIDDLDARNNYIRYPAKWKDIETTITKLKENNIFVSITQTISTYNIFYLSEFDSWASQNNLYTTYNFVSDPVFLNISNLSQSIRTALYQKLSKELSSPDKLSQLKFYLLEAPSKDQTKEFLKYTDTLDKIRNQSFKQTFPEYADFLKDLGYHTEA